MVSLNTEYDLDKIELDKNFIDLLISECQNILKDFNYDDRELSILICDDAFIQNLNKQFRQKDYATDVLSFAFDDDSEFILPNSSLGEIIISYEKAQSQSKEYGVPYEEEFARLAIHGLLHLLGYDHEESEDAHKAMFALQDEYMNGFMQKYKGTDSHLI